MSDIFGKIRTIGLVAMIVCAAIADTILYLCHQWVWAAFWSCIIALVVGFEAVCYIIWKKTISTMWRDWAKTSVKDGVISYVTLLLLATALLGLWVHLAFWGGMFK